MNRKLLLTASLLGIFAIIFGAFGAHALKKILSFEQLTSFETAVRYQMYHALFLILISNLSSVTEETKKRIYNFVLAGVLLFSGSIYLLVTTPLTHIDFKIIGPLTPIGGFFLILAWIMLFIDFYKPNKKKI